jgi:hypothetical protein
MSEDIQKGSTSPQPAEPWPGRPDGPKPDLKPPPYPKTIVAAGVLMIVSVGIFLVGFLWYPFTASGVWVLLGALPMAVYTFWNVMRLAIPFVRATSTRKDTAGIGGSLIVGGTILSLFFAYLEYSWQNLVVGGVPVPANLPVPANPLLPCSILAGAVALSGGILFLVGRAPYRAWFDAKNARKNGTPKEGEA